MVKLTIAATKPQILKRMKFALEGTDDLNDIESLAVFATTEKEPFHPGKPLGPPKAAKPTLEFRGEFPLKSGETVFWLACKLKPTASLTHKIVTRCDSIETDLGITPIPRPNPIKGQRIGYALRKHKDDGVHTYRIPALTTTPKGTLLSVFDMRRRMGRDLQEDIDIGLCRSENGGQSWEPVKVIMDMGQYGGLGEELNGCSDPGIIVDQNTGTIYCFAVWMNGNAGKHQWTGDGSLPGFEIGKSAQFLMVKSTDDGKTWSKPANLTRQLKKPEWWLLAPSPQSGITLPDGMLVMPIQGRDEKGTEFSTIMTSKDHGETWTVATPAYKGGSECQVVRLDDGSLMLNMRNERGKLRAVYTTSDMGKSWQPHPTHNKALIEPNCNGSLLRLDYTESGQPRHALIFANPHSPKGRTHQTIQTSFDNGNTWPEKHHLLLDEGRGNGYPSLTRIDKDHIGIVYEGSKAHLVFEKIPIKELLTLK